MIMYNNVGYKAETKKEKITINVKIVSYRFQVK